MSDTTSGIAPEISFTVEYQEFAGTEYNPDLKGEGQLIIRPDGPVYVFTGRPRRLLGGRPGEISLAADEISNVEILGNRIRFKTKRGEAGHQGQPFIFFCRDAGEAATVASLLPATVDRDHVEARSFHERLNELAEADSPWSSVTNLIISLNVAVFLVMGLAGAGWFEVGDFMLYVKYGADNGAATTDGEWWRLVTSMFLHYGFLHLAFNMWALYQAGHFVEKLYGRWPFALLYLSSGIAGSFVSILWNGDKIWSAGASGAVFGVYGAILGYMLREKQAVPRQIYRSLLRSTLIFAAYNILYGMAKSGIDNAAHAGGLLGGIGFGWLLARPLEPEIRDRLLPGRLGMGAIASACTLVLGVLITPRFEYSVSEEIAWDQLTKANGDNANNLDKAAQAALEAYRKSGDTGTYCTWIEREYVQFFEHWRQQIVALPLTKGRLTDKRRDAYLQAIDLALLAHRNLVAGLRNERPDAWERYQLENNLALKAIESLKDK